MALGFKRQYDGTLEALSHHVGTKWYAVSSSGLFDCFDAIFYFRIGVTGSIVVPISSIGFAVVPANGPG